MSLLDVDLNIESQDCIIRSWLDNNVSILKKWGYDNIPDPEIEIKGDIVNIRTNDKLKEDWTLYINPDVKKIPISLFKFGEVEGNIQVGRSAFANNGNDLETLVGMPTFCAGDMYIQHAQNIKSLQGLPEAIGGHLHLEGTPFNFPDDVQYFPENVMGNIYMDLKETDQLKAVELYSHVKFFSGHVMGYYIQAEPYGRISKYYDKEFPNPREYVNRRMRLLDSDWSLF